MPDAGQFIRWGGQTGVLHGRCADRPTFRLPLFGGHRSCFVTFRSTISSAIQTSPPPTRLTASPHNLDGGIEWRSIVTFVGWSVHQRTSGQTVDTHGVLRGQPESTTSEQHDWSEVRIETPVGECMCIALTGLLFVFLCSAVTGHALLLSAPQYQAQCKHRRHPPDSPPPPTTSTGG